MDLVRQHVEVVRHRHDRVRRVGREVARELTTAHERIAVMKLLLLGVFEHPRELALLGAAHLVAKRLLLDLVDAAAHPPNGERLPLGTSPA